MKNKTILEEALMDANSIENAIKSNTKEMLRSILREEINSKFNESDDDETEDEFTDEVDLETEEDIDSETEEEDETEEDIDSETEEEDETVDFTSMGTSPQAMGNILKVYEKMSDDDIVAVVKDSGDVELKDNKTGKEYIVKMNEEFDLDFEDDAEFNFDDEPVDDMDETIYEIEMDDELEDDMDETIYEIEMDDELEIIDDGDETEIDFTKDEVTEQGARTHARMRKAPQGKLYPKNAMKNAESRVRPAMRETAEYKALKTENKELKGKHIEYKDALKMFRDKLNEVAVLNANLAHTVRLFTENATTKEEKAAILTKFDSVKTINESKEVYKATKSELARKAANLHETIGSKMSKTPSNSSTINILTESKKDVDGPQIARIRDMMNKLNNKNLNK